MDAVSGSPVRRDRLATSWQAISRLRPRLPRDPGLAGLRRGMRTALVAPSAFAFAKLAVGDPQFTTFVVFGCFALLVLADFGGFRGPRACAYVGTTLVGAALVTLGSLVSPVPWQAGLTMLVVGFCVQFAGVFGGYAAACQPAVQLSFVLAASIAAPASSIGPRVAGWCLAGALATLAGVFLWPRFEQNTLYREAAQACRALAALVTADRHATGSAPARRAEARAAVDTVLRSYAATPKRPAGPVRRARAFAELIAELSRIETLIRGPLDTFLSAEHPCLVAGRALSASVVRALEGCADLLAGSDTGLDLHELQNARAAHRQALDRWAEQELASGAPVEEILDPMQADDALRVVSYLVLAAGGSAMIVAGHRLEPDLDLPFETPLRSGTVGLVQRIAATVRSHLASSSPVLHGSLRVGIGLALAVLISRELRIDHGFWVVLATLSVLRTNALATGRTTLQAIAGTTGGFAISAAFMAVAGQHTSVLWLFLPIAIFLAAYAATALGFVAGQAAFTVTVVILFNLISPAGWRLGLVRVEDVVVGASISVAVGLLLWPRGARAEFRRAAAELLEHTGDFVGQAFDQTMRHGAPENVARARLGAVRARARAEEAFNRLLRERGAHAPAPQATAAIVAAGSHAMVAGDVLGAMAARGYQAPGDAAALSLLHAEAHALVAMFEQLGERLRTMRPVEAKGRVSVEKLRQVMVRLLQDWRADPGDAHAAVAAVTLAEWIQLLRRLALTLDQPVNTTIEAARIPWWR